jgi:hypothetical protein
MDRDMRAVTQYGKQAVVDRSMEKVCVMHATRPPDKLHCSAKTQVCCQSLLAKMETQHMVGQTSAAVGGRTLLATAGCISSPAVDHVLPHLQHRDSGQVCHCSRPAAAWAQVDQAVVWLQITMDHAVRVQPVDTLSHLCRETGQHILVVTSAPVCMSVVVCLLQNCHQAGSKHDKPTLDAW